MDEPFLPPLQPTDNANKSSSKKTLLFWALLILMVVSIWNMFAPSSPPPRHTPPAAIQCSEGWSSPLYSWLFGLAPMGLIIFFLWQQLRNGSKCNLLLEPGHLALANGQLDQAAAGFREVMQRYRQQPQFRAVAQYNLAVALSRKGDLAGAIKETFGVEKGAGLLWSSEIRLQAASYLAELYARRGQIDVAERWVEDARKRLARSGQRLRAAAHLRIAEATVRCRQGRFEEALRLLDRDWRQLEQNLVVNHMRIAWLMRAFAASQLAGPRGDGSAGASLGLLRGGVCDYVAVEWPELRTFLVANDLSEAATH